METENKPDADMHDDGQGSQSQYSETTHLLQQQPNPSQGYPVYPPNMAGMPPPYPPPSGTGYGGTYGAPSSAPQQPQQVIVVGTNPPAPVIYVAVQPSFTRVLILSIVVLCFWNLPFGLVAFILARE